MYCKNAWKMEFNVILQTTRIFSSDPVIHFYEADKKAYTFFAYQDSSKKFWRAKRYGQEKM